MQEESFVGLRHRRMRWQVAAAEAPRFLEAHAPLLAALAGEAGTAERVRGDRHKGVHRMPAPGEPGAHAWLKHYVRPALRQLWARPPAVREAHAMLAMTQAGVPVPRVVAFGSTRALAGRRTSALVSVTPDRFATLGAHAHRVLVRGQGAREALFDDVGQLLALLRRIHEAGLFHGDVNLGNVLFDPAARAFCFIDFHRCGARPDPRERADDLGKLHEFLERWIPWEPWLAAMRAHYFGGDSELEAQVLAVWHALHRARVRGKVEGTVRNALEGKHRFARRRVGKAVVTWAVESAHGAEELVAFAREGAPADVRVLGEYRDTREARRAWAQAVGAAAEEAQEVVPVALVELEDPSRALLLGQKGFDPTYTLRWVFSLERFAAPPQARRDAPG